MNNSSYSPKESIGKCNNLKAALDNVNENLKREVAIDHNTIIREVLKAEYLKTCLVQEVKQVPSIDIQQWQDSK